MTWNYAYTPIIWPSVFTVLLLFALATFSWRRRNVPGTLPLMIACLFAAALAVGSVLEFAASDLATKISWVKVQAVFQVPIVTAITCFFLEYVWPGRWLTRRNLILLSIPCLLALVLVLINDFYPLLWPGFTYEGKIIPLRGPFNWIIVAYVLVGLGILNLIVFAWLFQRSPQHRWPVVIMITGQFIGRTIYVLDADRVLHSALPLSVLGMAFEFLIYAIALFGFRILDPIPLARQTAIEQLQDGMLVLGPLGNIVSLNPAARAILGKPEKQLIGHSIQDLLPTFPGELLTAGKGQVEMSLPGKQREDVETGPESRFYQLDASALNDWRGLAVGRLLILRDLTGQKQAQAQILEQQRALATLQERERLARELHDGIGQVLGYVKMQAQSARDRLAQNQAPEADSQLVRLIEVAQDAHADVREYILGVKKAASGQPGFLVGLKQYLKRFNEVYGLQTKLVEPPGWSDDLLEPTVEAQLLRIIQEALTNARKHARATCVEVAIQLDDNRAQVTVQDDGVGFDPALLSDGVGQKYGLGFLRERATEAGGRVKIHSTPGQGTRVEVDVPRRLL